MRTNTGCLLICSLILASGCSSSTTNQQTPTTGESAATPAAPVVGATPIPAVASASPASAKADTGACSLLNSADIQAVQGEALKDTKVSEHSSGGFVTSLCYYELPTASNSISLALTQGDAAKAGAIKEFWENTFGKDEKKDDKDRDKKKPAPSQTERQGEEEEGAPLEAVRGIGDEAFWSASRVGGALYVLKGNRYIRISVGGKGDAEAKLKKSKTLAQKALKRL